MEKLLIKTSRLIIRNLRKADLPLFYGYRSKPEVAKYQGFDIMTKLEAEEFIDTMQDKLFGEPGEWVQYAIEEIETGNIIGDCAIKLEANNVLIAEIGITISPENQKKGFAKEVLTGILRLLFEEKKLHRVVEIVDAENLASVNLLKSIGFRKEGHFVENIWFKGKWGSELQYAMLRSEWESRSLSNNK